MDTTPLVCTQKELKTQELKTQELISQLISSSTSQSSLSLVTMGCNSSSIDVLNLHLIPQQMPITAINAVFCNPGFVTLHLQDRFLSLSGDHITIKDAYSGVVWFKLNGSVFSLREKKTLLDVNHAPIATMKDEFSFFTPPKYNVYAGTNTTTKLFEIEAKITMFKTVLRVEFTDKVTGQRCLMGLEGDWRHCKAFIWLDRGETGVREPVGKIFRPLSITGDHLLGTQDYYLEVAPNVDVALMVLICTALDEKNKKSNAWRR